MLKNMKIRMRMLTSYGIIIVLTLIAIVTALIMLKSVGANLTNFYENNFSVVTNTWSVRRAVYSARASLFQSMIETDHQLTQECLDTAKEMFSEISATLPMIKEKAVGVDDLMSQIESKMKSAETYREEIMKLALNNQNEQAFKIMKEQYMPIMVDVMDLLRQIGDVSDQSAQEMVESGKKAVTSSIFIVAVVVVIAVGVAVFLGVMISNSIRKPIEEIEGAARNLAIGNLDQAVIHYESHDELGDLADNIRKTIEGLRTIIDDENYLLGEIANGNFRVKTQKEENYTGSFRPILDSLRKMANGLSSTLGQINQSADQVTSGSEQVSSGAQALSQGATEQASAVEELAATINEISEQVKNNAGNAHQASEKAGQVGHEMAESNEKMKDMIKAMGDITDSSNEIGKIIKTIEDIAFQTNILALNAAVEAARAGAAGKGFAVVADEVRNLANKSQEASKNTSTLIERSLAAVNNGTSIADETAKSLVNAVAGAQEVADTIDRISEASDQQAQSVMQVTQGVDQISSVVQTNSATAEESAAASEELSGQAQILKNLVGQFKLRTVDGLGAGVSSVPEPESGPQYAAPVENSAPSYYGSSAGSKY